MSRFLRSKTEAILARLSEELKKKRGLKWFISVKVRFVKPKPNGEDLTAEPHFRSLCISRPTKSTEMGVIYYSSLVYYGDLSVVAIANVETEKLYKYKQYFMTIFGNTQFHALWNILLESP